MLKYIKRVDPFKEKSIQICYDITINPNFIVNLSLV